MFPEIILIVAGVIGLITLVYLNEEKLRDLFGVPQRETKVEVQERETDLGTFRSAYGGGWALVLDGKEWKAHDRNGEPDPRFLERIPDIRRALPLWERKVREEEDSLDEYVLSYVSQGDAEDEVDLTFTHRESEQDSILFVTMRGGEIVDTTWMD